MVFLGGENPLRLEEGGHLSDLPAGRATYRAAAAVLSRSFEQEACLPSENLEHQASLVVIVRVINLQVVFYRIVTVLRQAFQMATSSAVDACVLGPGRT